MKDGQAFEIKRLNSNIEDIKKLWGRESEYTSKREVLFKWLTEQNPFAGNESPYFLLTDDKKVVGMVGHMPVNFYIKGEPAHGYLSHDTFLDGSCRGKGLGKLLMEGVNRQVPAFAGAIWFNEPNHRLYQKCGWHDIKDFYPYVMIFDPSVFLKERIRNRALLNSVSGLIKLALWLRAAGSIMNRPLFPQDVQISEADEFSEDMDLFFKDASRHFGVLVERSQEYLNWKFVHKPFNSYKRFVAYKEGQLSGYSVVKVEKKGAVSRGKIIDILAHPMMPDVFRALVHRSMAYCRGLNTSYMEIMCTFPSFINELKNFGFIRSRDPQWFMIINWEGRFQHDFITDIRNWYLTYSEADGDAWEADTA